MSSDFAISRFRHLQKLLLVHGHWCYTRLARMVVYYFYKNVVSSLWGPHPGSWESAGDQLCPVVDRQSISA